MSIQFDFSAFYLTCSSIVALSDSGTHKKKRFQPVGLLELFNSNVSKAKRVIIPNCLSRFSNYDVCEERFCLKGQLVF